MAYESLEQRMARGYLDLLPPFVPDAAAPVSASEQEAFYALMKALYRLAFDEPLLLVTTLHEDDAYPSRYKKPYGKPELIVNMKKFTAAMDALLGGMFLLGQGVDAKLNRRQRAILARLGVDDGGELPPAWVWMSTRPGASLASFGHCLFDGAYPYASDVYARLLGERPFRRLEAWMTAQGYRRFDIFHLIGSDCKLALTYANPAWSAERPRGGFEYKIRHTGISAQYDAYAQHPAVFGLCIPNGLKPYLLAFEDMRPRTRRFVLSHAKRCDGCRYCVQTDKTGARPLAAVELAHAGETHHVCPYFPGYGFSWTRIDDDLADQLIEILAFMDAFATR